MFGQKNSSDYINDANQSITQGYNEAQGYESPYTTYGSDDFNTSRNYLYKALGDRQDYSDIFTRFLSMSPEEMLNEAMGGYQESPFAQEKETVGLNAANNASTAAGMGGAPENQLLDAEIGNTIVNQDQGNYENQLMKALGVQGNVLQGYNDKTSQLMKLFQQMLGTENKASTNMANLSLKSGEDMARSDEIGAQSQRNKSPLKGLVSLVGAGAGLYEGHELSKILLAGATKV